AVYEATMRAEEHLALPRAVVADHNRLPTAQVQAGHGVLVGHAARQAERVHDGGFIRLIAPESRTAQRWTERGVVDRDDPPVPAGLVVPDHELLVTHLGDLLEELHDAVV